MMGFQERYDEIREAIDKAVSHSGRKAGSVALMAVSKMHSYDEIENLFGIGQTIFGENRVQEAMMKFPDKRPESMQVHLIGHLQSNKALKAVELFDGIDSVDSLSLARKLQKGCEEKGKLLPLLLQLKTSEEETKSGFESPDELYKALEEIVLMPNLRVEGLMTIGPLGASERVTRLAFALLRQSLDTCNALFPSLGMEKLSMGMSSDFAWAIEEGSTLVRVGTKLFGQRDYTG